ncbi:MAG: carboxy-S-adenosyl-L-methionine synthase CmoA [Planctomycetes bacterium]|nr:carboxy-S-adenosyl-L-methionine synthase CmoA [Planctomycetota bacterium]
MTPSKNEGTESSLAAQDALFSTPKGKAEDFNFGKETAAVFDDMLNRSVPYYGEIQRMVAELAADFAVDGTNIYDLGCSTCNTFLQLADTLAPNRHVQLIGIDSSPEMLEKAKKKLADASCRQPYELRRQNIDQGIGMENASGVLMILTLQFVRPVYRDMLVESIHRGLNDQGCFILVEKVLGEDSLFNRLFIQHYYDLKKRHGYSDLEIAQKREALENVLVPYRLEENKELLRRHGFRMIDVFFKWYNFCGVIAVK